MTPAEDERLVEAFMAPLQRLQPVMRPVAPRRRRAWPLVVGLAAVAALAVAVLAIVMRRPEAAGPGPAPANPPTASTTSDGTGTFPLAGVGLDANGGASATRWHLRERKRLAAGDRIAGAGPASYLLDSWYDGCASRSVVVNSTDPATTGWEFGGIITSNMDGGVGWLYDPHADTIYIADTNDRAWDTCGHALDGYSRRVDQGYMLEHGTRVPPSPALAAVVDPRHAHPTATIVHAGWHLMNGVYRSGLHAIPTRLGP